MSKPLLSRRQASAFLRAALAALVLGTLGTLTGTSASPAASATIAPVAKIPTGTSVMIRSEDYLADPITSSSPLVAILKRPYVRGISLHVGWKDIAPSSSRPAGDPAAIKTMLDRIASAERLAGRSRLPISLKYYPTDLPLWLRTPAPPATPELRTNALGMRVVSSSTQHQYNDNTDMPYSTDPVYQQQVRTQMATINTALGKYDPEARRVVALGFIAPFMGSAQMRVNYLPNQGFARTGSDPYWGQWTKDGHIAAIHSFVPVMAAQRYFRSRAWVFNFTSTPLLLHSEQMAVKNDLASAHPVPNDAVVSKTENLTVTYDTFDGPAPRTFADQIRLQTPTFGPVAVINEPLHGWELWAPFRQGCLTCNGPYAMPPERWGELATNSLYVDLQNTPPAQPQGTIFVELWAMDLVAPSPELEAFLTSWDADIRANAVRPGPS